MPVWEVPCAHAVRQVPIVLEGQAHVLCVHRARLLLPQQQHQQVLAMLVEKAIFLKLGRMFAQLVLRDPMRPSPG